MKDDLRPGGVASAGTGASAPNYVAMDSLAGTSNPAWAPRARPNALIVSVH